MCTLCMIFLIMMMTITIPTVKGDSEKEGGYNDDLTTCVVCHGPRLVWVTDRL